MTETNKPGGVDDPYNLDRHRERDDLLQLQVAKSELQCSLCTLRRIAPVPMSVAQSPANFDAGRERRIEAWCVKSDETGERRDAGNLNRPQAKTVPIEVCFNPLRHLVAFAPRQGARQKLHHARIGVQLGKNWPVAGQPTPQTHSLSA
ncbi:MAG TPA: hypothetical protein VNH11_01260 [Pirellulales bacterium]|nr:hypothetical protein [Pirellulales bacterium]